jgi:hypothetical protein
MNKFPPVMTRSLLLCLVFSAGDALGGQVSAIELNDGSVVVGEIVTAGNGTYTVKTDKLGTIHLKDTDILAIRSKAAALRQDPFADLPSSNLVEGLRSVRQRILGDPQLMQSVQALKDDLDIQKILHDPELMQAIQSGNWAALTANPKIQAVMNNPTVQGIYQGLGPLTDSRPNAPRTASDP